jgi:16S rRNA (uracil1498-N3)-methyltransferase
MSTERRLRAPSPLGDLLVGARVALGADAAHHARVLRLAVDDALVVFDGAGHEATARVVAIGKDALEVELARVRALPADRRAPTLVQCVPKGSKLDDVVRMATEVGVAAIHLAIAERSIARAEGRLDRLERIAEEAARQSEASAVPTVHAPAPLFEVAARAPSEAPRLVLSPRSGVRMREAIAGHAPWLVVGPEGGLTDAEEERLVALGWVRVRLETHVLRTESAGAIALAVAREMVSEE